MSLIAIVVSGALIGRGEFVTLLGASGCGKTTLMRIIDGLERPDTGAILAGT